MFFRKIFSSCSVKVPFYPTIFYLLKLSKLFSFLFVKGAASGHLYPDSYGWAPLGVVLLASSWAAQSHLQERTRKEARATWRSLVKHDSPLLGLSQSQGLINIYSFRLSERARATRTLIIAELSRLWVAGAWRVVSCCTLIGEYISFHLWWWLECCLGLHLNVSAG